MTQYQGRGFDQEQDQDLSPQEKLERCIDMLQKFHNQLQENKQLTIQYVEGVIRVLRDEDIREAITLLTNWLNIIKETWPPLH